jgi:pimeloyl-ACP methyl ester carboxylesterase
MRSSLPINGFEVAIDQRGDTSAPFLALWSPGRVETKDHPHIQVHLQAAAELGYLAVAFDPPGTGESSGENSDITMFNNVEAMKGLIEHYGNRPTVALGHSRGGTVAMVTAMQTPTVIGFVAVMSRPSRSKPSVDLEKVDHQIERKYDYAKNRVVEYVLGRKFFEDADQFRIIEGLAEYRKPKLFVGGNRDTIVEPEAVRVGYDAAAFPKEIVIVDAQHHYRNDPREILRVNKPVSAFLIKMAVLQGQISPSEGVQLVESLRPLQRQAPQSTHS